MSSIAIIPARGGSKRIPGKNIKSFFGKPIIAYSIDAALNCNLFSRVIVSTDDMEIAKVAEGYGATVPFYRSKLTSDDFTPLGAAIVEVLEQYSAHFDEFPEVVATILPTAPFLTAENLKLAHQEFVEKRADSLLSVSECSSSVYRSFYLNDKGAIEFNFPSFSSVRSQDLPKTFNDAGQFYYTKSNVLKETGKLSGGRNSLFVIPDQLVQDIDTIEDWDKAEKKYKTYYNE